jgi:hypothetical protein
MTNRPIEKTAINSGNILYAQSGARTLSIISGQDRTTAIPLVAATMNFNRDARLISYSQDGTNYTLDLKISEKALRLIPVAFAGELISSNGIRGRVTLRNQINRPVAECCFAGSTALLYRRSRKLLSPYDVCLSLENHSAVAIVELNSEFPFSIGDFWRSKCGFGYVAFGRWLKEAPPGSSNTSSDMIAILCCIIVYEFVYRRELCNDMTAP